MARTIKKQRKVVDKKKRILTGDERAITCRQVRWEGIGWYIAVIGLIAIIINLWNEMETKTVIALSVLVLGIILIRVGRFAHKKFNR